MVAVQTTFDFAELPAVAATRGPHRTTATHPVDGPQTGSSARRATSSARRTALPNQQLAALERALRARSNMPLRLTITDNRRTMISLRKRPSCLEVRLHHMFLQSDELTWSAVASYLLDADRTAAVQIGNFIERHREKIRLTGPERKPALTTAGVHHDLLDIYTTVKRRYFREATDARITWGRDPRVNSRARRSIKLGSYTAREALIRVHPALDAGYVPRFFVEYIVYHELLHHVLPPTRKRGRRDLHGPIFQAREREFREYEAALRWERQNLERLLRRDKRATTRTAGIRRRESTQ